MKFDDFWINDQKENEFWRPRSYLMTFQLRRNYRKFSTGPYPIYNFFYASVRNHWKNELQIRSTLNLKTLWLRISCRMSSRRADEVYINLDAFSKWKTINEWASEAQITFALHFMIFISFSMKEWDPEAQLRFILD